jgi:site-specific DNA-methyltransferase (adenine-specific)
MVSGSAAKYPVMPLRGIMGLPVQDICDKNAVLFLWATVPLLPEALMVMRTWGFEYKTALFWRKIMSLGMGYWFRGQVEILLLGVRGKIKPFRLQMANHHEEKVREHSRKPDWFRAAIEKTGLSPRIELFARQKTKGWDVWGNEVESDVELIYYDLAK